MKVESVNPLEKTVTFTDGKTITHSEFMEVFIKFWEKRIVGVAIVPIFYEYLFGKGGSKALELLMKGMKHEGFLLGSMDKWLTRGQKVALATIIVIIFVILIAISWLNSEGILPFGG